MKSLTFIVLLAVLATSAYAAIGDVCTDVGQECATTPETLCVGGFCVCRNGYADINGVCTIVLNADCSQNAALCDSLQNSECNAGTCKCAPGANENVDQCDKILDGECTESLDCQPDITNSECNNNGKCKCKTGFEESGLLCSKILGSRCLLNFDCRILPNSHCNILFGCTCDSGFRADADQILCEQVIGTSCTINSDCSTNAPNTACSVDHVCACSEGYKLHTDGIQCIQVLTGDCDAAADPNQCSTIVENSECKDSKCSCLTGYVSNNQGTKCLLTIGGPCADDVACRELGSATCTDANTCSCNDGFSGSTMGTTCLKDAVLGGSCVDQTQCVSNLGTNSTCSAAPSRKCWCLENYHYAQEKCYETKYLTNDCTFNAECQSQENPDRYSCIDNKCSCTKGNVPDLENASICVNSAGRNSVTLVAIFTALFAIISRFNSL